MFSATRRKLPYVYRMILFAHDGTEFAEAAKPHLIGLATATGAEVVLLRAVNTPVTSETGASPGSEPGSPVGGIAYNERVEQMRDELIAAGVAQVRISMVEGAPAAAILAAAADLGCDLVVMATHGRSGIERALLGSVADQVVRHARGFAVLLVRPDEDADPSAD
jgi:nucleotide-binding universal stress UspA family protein